MVNIIDVISAYILFRMLRYMFLASELLKGRSVELYQSMYFVDIIVAFISALSLIIKNSN
ncbi:MAG: hypothetical protein ACRCTZ_07970 [Sarcina sp.]